MAWDLTNAVYENKSFDPSPQVSIPNSVGFKNDGTKAYIFDFKDDSVSQFTLSTAWDISTAVFDTGKTFSFVSQDSTAQCFFIKPDGTKMYMGGNTQNVYEYDITTAWDISTGSYTSNALSTSAQVNNSVISIHFKPDGTELYVLKGNRIVYQYTLPTAWDISTATFTNSLDLSTLSNFITDIYFKNDGTKWYVTDLSSDKIYQYSFSTAWDISTGTKDTTELLLMEGSDHVALTFKPDGTKFYVTSINNANIFQYSAETPPAPTFPAAIMHHMQIAGQITN